MDIARAHRHNRIGWIKLATITLGSWSNKPTMEHQGCTTCERRCNGIEGYRTGQWNAGQTWINNYNTGRGNFIYTCTITHKSMQAIQIMGTSTVARSKWSKLIHHNNGSMHWISNKYAGDHMNSLSQLHRSHISGSIIKILAERNFLKSNLKISHG